MAYKEGDASVSPKKAVTWCVLGVVSLLRDKQARGTITL